MKRLKFLIQVVDKNTKDKYEEGQIVEFEDKRANEILEARLTSGEHYAIEVKKVEKKSQRRSLIKRQQ